MKSLTRTLSRLLGGGKRPEEPHQGEHHIESGSSPTQDDALRQGFSTIFRRLR
ncbi:hypothetical protein [Nocardioides donggukensis]|uniref:Uncharacterized protein n=1 Tax=Nocardioides donggukensis TaxID=2774019 RepID=A0A927Q375_9ACTN|nr:hypothetical protein [Nocardioides donggukensis]MBD8870331.1 hypothetical protein [Nocardioides donggukensis]